MKYAYFVCVCKSVIVGVSGISVCVCTCVPVGISAVCVCTPVSISAISVCVCVCYLECTYGQPFKVQCANYNEGHFQLGFT